MSWYYSWMGECDCFFFWNAKDYFYDLYVMFPWRTMFGVCVSLLCSASLRQWIKRNKIHGWQLLLPLPSLPIDLNLILLFIHLFRLLVYHLWSILFSDVPCNMYIFVPLNQFSMNYYGIHDLYCSVYICVSWSCSLSHSLSILHSQYIHSAVFSTWP